MISSEEDRHLKLAGESDCAPEPLPTLRHSTAHLMAQAVKQLFPEVKVTIGPAIEDGFYYDFAKPTPFTPEDLERIEKRMRELAKADQPFVRTEMSRDEAVRFFEERGEPFKVEIIQGIDDDRPIAGTEAPIKRLQSVIKALYVQELPTGEMFGLASELILTATPGSR